MKSPNAVVERSEIDEGFLVSKEFYGSKIMD
jgi:hypothetical protein